MNKQKPKLTFLNLLSALSRPKLLNQVVKFIACSEFYNANPTNIADTPPCS